MATHTVTLMGGPCDGREIEDVPPDGALITIPLMADRWGREHHYERISETRFNYIGTLPVPTLAQWEEAFESKAREIREARERMNAR